VEADSRGGLSLFAHGYNKAKTLKPHQKLLNQAKSPRP